MAVSVNFSLNATTDKIAESNSVPGGEDGTSQDFSLWYEKASLAGSTELAPPVTGDADSEQDTDEQSAKNLAAEEAAALLMLFLFSQQMSTGPKPPEITTYEDAANEDAVNAQSTTSPTPGSVNPAGQDASKQPLAEEALEEVAESFAEPIKKTDRPTEKTATDNSRPTMDKDLRAAPAKIPTPAANPELPATQPAIQEDKQAPEATKSNAATRTVSDAHAAPLVAPSQTVQPSAKAQSAALALRGEPFSEMLSHRVMWLSSQNLQSAQIELSPKEFGTLEVHVALAASGAQVQLASSHAEVRTVLEGQLHRLQEMLENQGLPAPRLSVLDSSFSQHKEQSSRQTRANNPLIETKENEESPALAPLGHQALIDYYA